MLTPCNACHYYHFKCLRDGACKHANVRVCQQQQSSNIAINPVANTPTERRSALQMGGSSPSGVQPIVG